MSRSAYRIGYGSGPSRGLALAISFAVICGAALMLQQGLNIHLGVHPTMKLVPVTPDAPPAPPKVDLPTPPVNSPNTKIVVPMPNVPPVDTGSSNAPTDTTTVPPNIAPSLRSSSALPTYPETALANCEQGMVTLSLRIGANGRVIAASVATSSGYSDLDQAALNAARGWRYRPARLNGKAVETTITQPVRFNLADEVGRHLSKRELQQCLAGR